MSIKGNVFSNTTTQKSALDTVRETLRVSANGSVSFKSRLGRGSGSPVEIPGESFDAFVDLMRDLAERREEVAAQESAVTDVSSTSGSETTDTE